MPLQKWEPLSHIASLEEVTQRQYKNAETIICEFMAIQTYDEDNPPTYKDFNLQQFHDFVAEKIEALDPRFNLYQWERWPYQTKQE